MAELIWKGKHTRIDSNQSTDLVQTTYGNPTLTTLRCHTLENGSELPSDIWYNRLIWGDQVSILPTLQQEFTNAIDLIYIDPPFMTGRTFSNGDTIAYCDTWNNDLDTYLQWLYKTLQALYTLLASDGSLYLHLDWRTIHYAKIILDEIFGSSTSSHGPGFKNEIIWHYQSGGYPQRYYGRKHDTILLYTKSGDYCFHSERVGQRRGTLKRNHMRKEVGPDGRIAWTIRTAGKVYTYDEEKLMSLSDVWNDISHLHQKDPERTGYATQKPKALLERIILASSEDDDLVLDCFCGSGVTAAVAEQLGRRWIACDKSEIAINMSCERLLLLQRHYPFVLQELTEM
jgi:site-specific DNA-methyltransferase (adenine-specific)/adenine-specific DNA-methyltransferase